MGDEEINGYDEIRNKIIKINIRMELKGLQPEALWHYFEEICRIPRPSTREEKMAAYLMAFAEKRGFPAKQDEAGNVLISKPASVGMEQTPTDRKSVV